MTEQTQLWQSETPTNKRNRNPATAPIVKPETKNRYAAIHSKFRELSQATNGLRPRFEDVKCRLAELYFLKPDTVEQILRRTDI